MSAVALSGTVTSVQRVDHDNSIVTVELPPVYGQFSAPCPTPSVQVGHVVTVTVDYGGE